jgi:hypothetical protein
MTETTTAPDEEEAWVTMALHPPSPNARFAAFVNRLDDGTYKSTVLAVDYVALQQITLAPKGDDDDDAADLETMESRVVPLVFDWTGAARYCVLGGDEGFAALGPTEEAVAAKGHEIANGLRAAEAAAATPS